MATHWIFRMPTRHVEQEMTQVHGDSFAAFAEAVAKGLGTKTFLIWQTLVVVVWIALNLVATAFRWDPYPFILLNLAFSTQAAYAAPFIIYVGNRQEKRAKVRADIEFENELRNRVYVTALCKKFDVNVDELEVEIQKYMADIARQEDAALSKPAKHAQRIMDTSQGTTQQGRTD